MNENLINFLKNFGLTEKQSKIYLACLELGKSPISKIARKSGLKRTTLYNIIDSLLEKGLLSKYGDEKGQKFLAESPEKLFGMLESKTKELAEWMPNLLAITNTGGSFKPEVKFYQGEEGIKTVYEDTINSCEKNDEILSIASGDDLHHFVHDFIESYGKRRASKDITVRAIAPDTEATKKYVSKDKIQKRNTRMVPAKDFPICIEKNIYKDKVAFMNFRSSPFGVIIKSPQIANSERAIFELLWKKLPDKSATK